MTMKKQSTNQSELDVAIASMTMTPRAYAKTLRSILNDRSPIDLFVFCGRGLSNGTIYVEPIYDVQKTRRHNLFNHKIMALVFGWNDGRSPNQIIIRNRADGLDRFWYLLAACGWTHDEIGEAWTGLKTNRNGRK